MLIALISGAVALCFGIAQFYLDTRLFSVVFEGKYGKTALYACLKFALYGAGIALLVLKFQSCAIPAAVGFGAGFLIYMAVYTVLKIVKKDG